MNNINSTTWTLDHYGHAVRDLSQAISAYEKNFGFKVTHREIVEETKVELVFLGLGNCLIELLAPLPGNISLSKFLDSRGEALHHVCFCVPDINKELKRLDSQGIKLIDKKPRSGAKGSLIAFIYPSETSGALIELCQHSNS